MKEAAQVKRECIVDGGQYRNHIARLWCPPYFFRLPPSSFHLPPQSSILRLPSSNLFPLPSLLLLSFFLDSLESITCHRVIDNAVIVMDAEAFWVQMNYQVIHLLDFLPAASWKVRLW